ncbi:MAG: aldo/keto reductase [Hyphomicrobiales bacterium]|nr:aldo/keto reductase [Hyphomicrobiales bacterium]
MAHPRAFRGIGQTGLKISQMGFGGAPLGGFRGAIDETLALATVRAAVDAGLNYFDTSPLYGYGRSELRLGQVLRLLPRDRFVLSTKVGRWLKPLDEAKVPADHRPGGLPFQAEFDYSAAGAERSLDQSMMRLGIPRIDIAFIHDVDVFTHGAPEEADRRYREAVEGCYRYLEQLRRDGVIGAIGVGLNETERSLRFARDTDIDCILLAGDYTLLSQKALDELLPLCMEKNISLVIGSPYNSGILVTGPEGEPKYNYKPAPPEIIDKVRRMQAVCRRHRVSLSAAALQFPLAHKAVASVIPGAVSPTEVLDNFARMAEVISDDFWRELVCEGLLPEAAPVPRLGE